MPFSIENAIPADLTRARAGSRAGVSFSLPRRRSTCRVLPVFLFLSILLPAAAAADILIEPKVGFHGVFQLGRPFPIEVNLNNIGRPADGILEIQIWKGGANQGGVPYQTFHRREVFAGAHGPQFTIDPDFSAAR
jgi:hypothetical protein